MWILFAVSALVLLALDETIDKVAIVRDKTIDLFAATFWRNLLFLAWMLVLGGLGFLGPLKILLSWPIFLLAVMFTGSAFFYTYLLKKIELTSSTALSYATPFLYLIVDAALLKLQFTLLQAAGILLLTAGGMLFVINPRKRKLREEFTPKVWAIFVYGFLISGIEYYAFKYYFDGLNEVSYYSSIWLVVMGVLLAIVIIQNKWRVLWHAAREHQYFGKMVASKGFDAVSAYLWLHAISLASVSQVNSLDAVYPLILVGVVYVFQGVFKIKAEEDLSRGALGVKLAAVALLCLGGLMVG